MTDEPAEAGRPTSGRKRFWLRLLFKLFASVGVLILLLLIAFAFVGFLVYQHVTEPGFPGEVVRVTIPQGVTGREVGRLLTEQGLLEHEGFLRIAMHFDDTGKPIKHGLYALPRGLSPRELLHVLQQGPNRAPEAAEIPPEGKVTIPEGRTLHQMAQTFDDPGAFLNAASDPALLERLGIDAPNLEGFLMPDTYYFDDEPSPSALVARMVGEFEAVYADLLEEFPEAGARDKMEVVTIASLIEKEARADEERPLIAAVIANRVRRGMPLELDATVQYALGKFGERVLYEDKEVDSPYNTYKYAGLPPGPIANPGRACLRAAMNPADADYLYFVSNADGRTHTFSRSLSEHTRAVARYRRAIASQRRELRQQERASSRPVD